MNAPNNPQATVNDTLIVPTADIADAEHDETVFSRIREEIDDVMTRNRERFYDPYGDDDL